jgi:hypothetical protein
MWLLEDKISPKVLWQIDIIAVRIDLVKKSARIRHFKDITL